MKKIKYNIPKGSKDCKGVECEKDLEFDIEIPETAQNFTTIPTPSISSPGTTQMLMPQTTTNTPAPPPQEQKTLSHDDMIDLIPTGVNAISCPGGDCGHMKLKNKKQTKKYKICPHGNCEANTVPKDAEFCPYCEKSIDPDEELDDGVQLEVDED